MSLQDEESHYSHDPSTSNHQTPSPSSSSRSSTTPAIKSPKGPDTWTPTQKWTTISTASLVCFTVGMNATSPLAAPDSIASSFNLANDSFDYTFLLVTAWNLGAAIVPLFILPLMEDFGVCTIYYATYTGFLVFVVVQAFAPRFAALVVGRVGAGCFGGVLQNCVDGVVADVCGEDVNYRALAITAYIFALLGGVTVGPVFGGLVITSLEWRWILYIQLIIYGALVPCIWLGLKDPRPMARPGSKQSVKDIVKAALDETVLRAVRMLFTEFVVGSFTLLSSFAFGTVFTMTQSIPQVFGTLYGWSTWQTDVVQLAIFIGEAIGMVLCIFQDKIVYPRYAYRGSQSLNPIPEPRLYMVIPCSIFGLTAGFFIYGWTSFSYITWVLPALGLMLIGIGIMVIVQGVSTYVTDCYSAHASGAISGVAFGENIFAAFLPLATRSMYSNLGFQWASSLLGFVGILLSLAPVVLVWKGETIRAKSRYAG